MSSEFIIIFLICILIETSVHESEKLVTSYGSGDYENMMMTIEIDGWKDQTRGQFQFQN